MNRPLAVWVGAVFALLGAACDESASGSETDARAEDAHAQDAVAEDAGADAATETDAEPPSEPRPVALVHSALWSPVPAAEDPFAPATPVRCSTGSFGEEPLGGELVFYVSTDLCPAISVRQATRADVAAGDTLRVRLFHFPLVAPEPATAKLVLRLGEDEVVREEIPIPSAQA
ncbi:MAG TPA: hypothetical protein VFZ61_24085, partial [Polyangiales bacterium]